MFHLFVIRVDDRDGFLTHIGKQGIGSLIHYPIAPHKQKALEEFAHLSFPVSEQIHQQVVSIPLFPGMTDDEMLKVLNTVNSY